MYPGCAGDGDAAWTTTAQASTMEGEEEAPPTRACWVHHCEDLEGLTAEMTSNCSSVGDWAVSTGHEGQRAMQGSTVQGTSNSNTTSQSHFEVRFWMVAYDAGFLDAGHSRGDGEWGQAHTTAHRYRRRPRREMGTIGTRGLPFRFLRAGTIRISFPYTGVYSRRLDEFELWCNP